MLWWLFVFNVSIIAWIILSILILINYNQEFVVWFVRGTYVATSLSLLSYVSFVRKNISNKFDPVLISLWISTAVISILSLTEYIIKGVSITEYNSFVPVIFGDYAFLFIANFIIAILILLFPILQKSKEIKGLESLRIRYVTTSMVLGGIVAVLTNVIVPSIVGTSGSALLGPLAMGIVSSITTYSYIENRLFSINFVIRSFVYYLFTIFLPLGLIYLTISLQQNLFGTPFSTDAVIFAIICSIIFALSFSSLQEFFKKRILPTVISSRINAEDTRDQFTKVISTKLDLNELGLTTISTISKSFNVKSLGLIIFNKNNAAVLYRALRAINPNKFDSRDLLQVIYYWDKIKHSTIIVKDEISQTKIENPRLNRILNFMETNKIEVILPLNRKVQLNGVVMLGKKEDLSPYTVEDISFLESIIINASIAFGRAILHQEVEDLNRSLQDKVDLQTKELKLKVTQLEEARRKENDMIDIMGHELRTPATVIKLNIDFLHKYIDKLPNDRESYLKYVTRIKDAVETEIKLINTLLTSAKLAGNKIELDFEKVDVFKELDMALHAEEAVAKEKGINLINKIKEDTFFIHADHARSAEIFYNLVSNAVRYTEKGSVLVDAVEEDDFVKVMVIDTGRGIAKSDLPKLGKKFYRTKTYIDSSNGDGDNVNIVRPGGTGLGLYVTFGLTKKMGGKVEVESEVGKGSTFSIYLPKYTNQDQSKIEDSKDMFTRLKLK